MDPREYRKRLAVRGAVLLPILALVFGFHARDALRRDQSLAPVLLGVVLAVAVLGGTVYFVAREGPDGVAARSKRLMKWIAPIAIAVAVLRLLAWLLAGTG